MIFPAVTIAIACFVLWFVIDVIILDKLQLYSSPLAVVNKYNSIIVTSSIGIRLIIVYIYSYLLKSVTKLGFTY